MQAHESDADSQSISEQLRLATKKIALNAKMKPFAVSVAGNGQRCLWVHAPAGTTKLAALEVAE